MALAHFWMKSLGRDAKALPASIAVYYLKREAEFAAEAYLARTSKSTKDRQDLRHEDTRNLPAWAEDSPGKFFSAAERYEGVNRYHAVMLQFSLPKEMTHEQHLALTNDFIDATMPDKPLIWVKHEPLDKYRHEPQPHVHILLSARCVDEFERGPGQTFQRWNAKYPERGGAKKDLFWSRRQAPEQLRQAFTDITNMHAEKLGLSLRIDSRSLYRRDIDRKPMSKEEDRPTLETLAAEQRRAAAAWEQRKAYRQLGAVQDIPREEFVLLVRQWTREYARGTALPRVSPEQWLAWAERDLAQTRTEVVRLERQRDRAHAAVMIAEHRQRQPQRGRSIAQHLARDEHEHQGLQGPDLERTRGRDREGVERD